MPYLRITGDLDSMPPARTIVPIILYSSRTGTYQQGYGLWRMLAAEGSPLWYTSAGRPINVPVIAWYKIPPYLGDESYDDIEHF